MRRQEHSQPRVEVLTDDENDDPVDESPPEPESLVEESAKDAPAEEERKDEEEEVAWRRRMGKLPSEEKVGHFLYFPVCGVLGSDKLPT